MWVVYSRAIGKAVGQYLSDREATSLAKLLSRLVG
jgi:hypothetical protein